MSLLTKEFYMATITVTYCSNYNGAYLLSDDVDVSEHDEDIITTIVDFAVDDTDEDGGYHGDICLLEEFCIKTVHDAFGADVNVIFEEDTFSS